MRCSACGFDWEASAAEAAAILRTSASVAWLPGDDAVLRRRPRPGTWSPIEYAAHTRDAIGFYADRIRRVLSEDGPQLEAWDPDEMCERLRYRDQDPILVVRELRAAADHLATAVDRLGPDELAREGVGSEGGPRSVLTLVRRAAHEVQHHAHDVPTN